MRKHNGMRPQDIVILLKIVVLKKTSWQLKDLSRSLYISASEVSESLNRSYMAGLIDADKKIVYRQSLAEFIQYGLHYVFPQSPGSMANGIPTAHSHPFMDMYFKDDAYLKYVWPEANGKVRGLSVEPLYPAQTKAVMEDELLYKLLALIDVIRIGRVREVDFAVRELKRSILNDKSSEYYKD